MKALVLLVLVGCTGDLVEPWQLDHDRIVAVRSTPPRIPAGATAQLDVLVATAGADVTTLAPDSTVVVSPPSLASAMNGATVTAPSEETLATARAELGLDPGAPIPLDVELTANGFTATKTVWLGDTATNPSLDGLEIEDGSPGDDLVLPVKTDVRLAVTADDSVDNVTWLTSCGTMHDFDLSRAYLRIEPADPQAGQLVVVYRGAGGGVSWRIWPVRASE
ncbi:MAG TPA: hypothetical protein VGM90_06070 [Kofleriaceae bacterium]|jgi:hypothetical protein